MFLDVFNYNHSAVLKGVVSLKHSLFVELKRDLNSSFSINKKKYEKKFIACKFINKQRCLKVHTAVFLSFRFIT